MPLGRTARYYKYGTTIKGKSKPKNAERARKVKSATDKSVGKKTRKKRAELNKIRRNKGIYGKGGKDVSHTGSGIRMKSPKSNRGSKTDTPGDKRARGKGRKNPNLGPKKKK